jgi:hypothetical protein
MTGHDERPPRRRTPGDVDFPSNVPNPDQNPDFWLDLSLHIPQDQPQLSTPLATDHPGWFPHPWSSPAPERASEYPPPLPAEQPYEESVNPTCVVDDAAWALAASLVLRQQITVSAPAHTLPLDASLDTSLNPQNALPAVSVKERKREENKLLLDLRDAGVGFSGISQEIQERLNVKVSPNALVKRYNKLQLEDSRMGVSAPVAPPSPWNALPLSLLSRRWILESQHDFCARKTC